MAEDFLKNLVKGYTHWEIYVHENQGYLGRSIVWCKRAKADDLTNATIAEQAELFAVLSHLKEAVQKVFQPDWFNYSFLGNETRHLHAHFVPRYAAPKTFMELVFEDKRYGHNYRTHHDFQTPEAVVRAVREKLQSVLR